jgi:protein-disulfide isomerase
MPAAAVNIAMPRSACTARLLIWSIAALCAASSVARAGDMTPDQRKEFEGIVHDYLVDHPEVLLEAIQAVGDKQKNAANGTAATVLKDRRQEVVNDPQSPVAGSPKGDVTLVEFFDYRCAYCKKTEPSLEQLLADDHQLRLVYKEFPLLGPTSEIAAHAALAARLQGKYDAFHGAMMAAQGNIDDAAIYGVASSVGLDLDRLKQDMNSTDIDQQLKANLALGKALNIPGTPAFVIADQIVPGALDLASLKRLITTARGE